MQVDQPEPTKVWC